MNMKTTIRLIPLVALLAGLTSCGTLQRDSTQTASGQWSTEKANSWYQAQPWLVGCNFIPSTAINQLEMWQADTWDPATIDRELGWAADLGFTSIRVYLHDIVWDQDRKGFLKRMDEFLGIADKHGIGVMFVLFDGVWDPFPKAGKQREPRPHIHNSGWVQNPGREILSDPVRQDALKGYVQGVIKHFRNDRRVQVWDIFNEPDNPVPQYRDVELPNKAEVALQLLKKSYAWAREVRPSQPLTSGVWIGNWGDESKLTAMERFQLEESDVITFHSYNNLEETIKCVNNLRRYNRPILCTEYMARGNASTFDPKLGYFQRENVGAYNWGFVDGKSQTIYPWDSWRKQYDGEPSPWFHDILRRDGTPYDRQEVEYIKAVTRKAKLSKPARRAQAEVFTPTDAALVSISE
jgi:hypothetical protein